MRIASGLIMMTILFSQATPALAFSRDITITSAVFSADLDTLRITLSRDPQEKIAVLYDFYVGDSLSSFGGGGVNTQGNQGVQTNFRSNFSFFSVATRIRIQLRVCPYDEPYTGRHLYQYCSTEFVTYITYDPRTISNPPTITNATVSTNHDSITVKLSPPIQKGYIQFERWGSGSGYDYSSMQYRADGKATVMIGNLLQEFAQSGTSGKQTITLRACTEVQGATDGSTLCGPTYPVTIDLGGSASFRDVPNNHPNAEAIRFVQQQGIVAGYPDGTFLPNYPINRAEFTKIITLYTFGQKMIDMCATHVRFIDVPPDAWYIKYICRAQDSALAGGYPDGSFHPGSFINFSEAAKIIALADKSGDPAKKLPVTTSNAWYEPYVRYLSEHGAIPVSIGKFDQFITRGEMAEMIHQLKVGGVGGLSTSYEELMNGSTSGIRYKILGLPSYTVTNYARNIVYRYAITSPPDRSAVIKSQTFTLNGGRWSGPQLAISAGYDGPQIDTWASDANWTGARQTTLRGSLVIPPSQTRILTLTVNIGIPTDMGYTVEAKHSLLEEQTLDGL